MPATAFSCARATPSSGAAGRAICCRKKLAGDGTCPSRPKAARHITRQVRTEIVVEEKGIKSQPLSGDERVKSYAAASRDKSQATLTVREKSYETRIPVPISEWEFAVIRQRLANRQRNNQTKQQRTYFAHGFKPGHIYEFIYPAKNPLVLGLGFAVVRDLVSSCATR